MAGISNAVLVTAHPSGSHSLAMTVDGGTNRYWGWGYNDPLGQVGNGATTNQYSPTPLQFCTRCQRCVQLGTSGSFTAQCNGTLYLYFNDDQTAFGDNGTNSYKVTFPDFGNTNLTVMGANNSGVAVGAVTNGGTYSYSANGFCARRNDCIPPSACETDANGMDHGGNPVNCSDFSMINKTNAVCPMWQCFSLVGKIQ